MDAGPDLYTSCCDRLGIKPNSFILSQINRADVLNVRTIDASQTLLGNRGVLALLYFVQQHRCVEQLLLRQNGMEANSIELLAQILLEGHPCLQRVDLAHNAMSTPSARLLWDAARERGSRLMELVLSDCGVDEEWVARLQRTLANNRELEAKGFWLFGPPRNPLMWKTVFVLVIGSEEQAARYCQHVLLPLGSYVAHMRLRVAPLVIEAHDTQERALAKLRRCVEPSNYHLPWCAAFVNDQPMIPIQRFTLEQALQAPRPAHPPLRDKLGRIRPPVYRDAANCFVYVEVSEAELAKRRASTLPSAKWKEMAGFGGNEPTVGNTSGASLITPSSFLVRCQSDLLSSFNTIFSEDATDETTREEETSADEANLNLCIEREAPWGALHVKKTRVALDYVLEPPQTTNLPLVLYGAGKIGKGEILSNVAHHIRTQPERFPDDLQVAYFLTDTSLTLFLFRLLARFSPLYDRSVPSLPALMRTVRDAMESYRGPPLLVLVPKLDWLDLAGCEAAVALDWLPVNLPHSLKLLLSLNTECAFLPLLRTRSPQPFECQVPPLSEIHRVQLFKQLLLERQVSLPGLEMRDIKRLDDLKGAEKKYLEREDSDTLLYAQLATVYMKYLATTSPHAMNEYETLDMMESRLPNTNIDLVNELCRVAEEDSNALTVGFILLCLSTAPLPVPDLQYVCEELGPCQRHSTLPALILLTDQGIVSWAVDSTVQVPHPWVRQILTARYTEHADRVSVLVENHLYRLVITRSLHVSSAFKYLMSVLITNGNVAAASSMLQDTAVLDNILSKRGEGALHIVDGVFRLFLLRSIVAQLLLAGDTFGLEPLQVEGLRRVLHDVQHYQSHLFQTALLAPSVSPLSTFAHQHLDSAPYPVLVPQNSGAEDKYGTTLYREIPLHFCHCRGDVVAATSPVEVVLCRAHTGERLAVLESPFENENVVKGALLACGTRVVVVGEEQLLVWDYESNSQTLFSEAVVSTNGRALDSFGTLLVARRTNTKEFCMMDVTKKIVIHNLPLAEECQDAMFCGSTPLVVGVTAVHLLDAQCQTIATLTHDGVIGTVACDTEGRLIAVGVGATLWLWTSSGTLLHCMSTGISDITALCFDYSGAQLLTQQYEGVRLWKTVTGLEQGQLQCGAHLPPVDLLCFNEDGNYVLGREGSLLYVWDARSCDVMGAFRAPRGVFTFACEHGNQLLATLSDGGLKMYDLRQPIPSLEEARSGILSTNVLENGKLSYNPIRSVCTNSTGTLLCALDATGKALLYSLATGSEVSHVLPAATCAVLISVDVLLYTTATECRVFMYYISTGKLDFFPLPHDIAGKGTLTLFTGTDEQHFGVIHTHEQESRVFGFNAEKKGLLCQLPAINATLSFAYFFGSFIYTVEGTSCLRLWSATRMVQRAQYQHDKPITATTCASNGILHFLDAAGHLFCAHVEHITSARASFVCVQVPVPLVSGFGTNVSSMAFHKDHFIFVRKDGTVQMVSADGSGSYVATRVMFDGCMCVATKAIQKDVYVFTGHKDGCVRQSRLVALNTDVA